MSEQELSRDTVMSRRFDLVEQIAIAQGRHKLELEPLNEELSLCEKFIQASMLEAGEQQVKTSSGHMAFFTTQDSVKVGDWNETLAYIRENNAYALLNQAVNKTSVKEYIEAHNAPPPGVTYEARKVLAWRRGKA